MDPELLRADGLSSGSFRTGQQTLLLDPADITHSPFWLCKYPQPVCVRLAPPAGCGREHAQHGTCAEIHFNKWLVRPRFGGLGRSAAH